MRIELKSPFKSFVLILSVTGLVLFFGSCASNIKKNFVYPADDKDALSIVNDIRDNYSVSEIFIPHDSAFTLNLWEPDKFKFVSKLQDQRQIELDLTIKQFLFKEYLVSTPANKPYIILRLTSKENMGSILIFSNNCILKSVGRHFQLDIESCNKINGIIKEIIDSKKLE
jgi:hypothetical protein